MPIDDSLRRMIDNCRLNSDDLQQPDMRGLAEALSDQPEVRQALEEAHAWDAQFEAALWDAPVPAGLQAKLLEAAAPPVAPATTRRPILYVVAAVLAAAGLAPAAWWWFGGENARWNAAGAAELAAGWAVEHQDEEFSTWNGPESLPADRELPEELTLPPIRWRRVEFWGDPQALACSDRHGDVMLIVAVTGEVRGLPDAPPRTPDFSSGVFCVGVWRQGDRVFALIVRGTPDDYRRRIPTPPIA